MAGSTTRELIVYVRTEACGRLERAEELGYRFAYDSAWLDAHPNELLSMSLPRQEAPFEAAATKPFFRGLLPEGRRRERLEGRHRLKEGDDFGLLAEIGGDCPGAVAVLMPDEDPAILHPAAEIEPIEIDPAELIRNLRGDVATNVGQQKGKRRLSLAGAQPKEGVWLAAGDDPATAKLFLPQGSAASTHILKPALNNEFAGIVANEAFCMLLAGRLGLRVPRVAMRQLGGVDCFIVERFDRERRDGLVYRLHQEDFCQALGAVEKYQEDGGPGLRQIGELVRRLSVPAKDMEHLLRALLFNYLIANADAHAKNYALLHLAGGRREMAPLYDLVSTEAFDVARELALYFGDQTDPDAVTRGDLDRAAADLRIRPTFVASRAEALARAIIPEAVTLRQDGHFRARVKLTIDAIRRRVRRISDIYELGIDHQAELRVEGRTGGWIS
jgi:serine/threonine-protein kinase HipA